MIINDLKSTFKSMRFWVFIIFMFVLNIYAIFMKVPQLNPYDSIAYIETKYAINSGFLNQFALFEFATASVYIRFIPIVCSFIYGLSFLRERKKGFNVFINTRVSNKRYCISKFIANGVIGGVSVTIPTVILFYILNVFIGGSINDTKLASGGIFYDIISNSPYVYIALIIFFEFLVGFTYSTIALAASTIFNSEILVLLAPGIFFYVTNYATEIMKLPLPFKTKIAIDFGLLADGLNGYELFTHLIILTIVFGIIFFYFSRKEYVYEK